MVVVIHPKPHPLRLMGNAAVWSGRLWSHMYTVNMVGYHPGSCGAGGGGSTYQPLSNITRIECKDEEEAMIVIAQENVDAKDQQLEPRSDGEIICKTLLVSVLVALNHCCCRRRYCMSCLLIEFIIVSTHRCPSMRSSTSPPAFYL